MVKRIVLLCLVLLVVAACQPQTPSAPTVIPFPTVTVGWSIRGDLPPVIATPQDVTGLANPATAVALSNRPTATPSYNECPTTGDAEPGTLPESPQGIITAITTYLNQGGNLETLEDVLRDGWDLMGENGYFRNTVDFNGEDTPEIIIGYTEPGDAGAVLILGCVNGRYDVLYDQGTQQPDPPEILMLGDVNNDNRPEIIFTARSCDETETCTYNTRIISWQPDRGRFVNLVVGEIISDNKPVVNDRDNDAVQELVIVMDQNGTTATGPLRTGQMIYDWNGTVYTLSLRQFDSPRYRIQVIHEADRTFSRLQMEDAAELYELALEDERLRYWFNDGPTVTLSYSLYRLILAYSMLQDLQSLTNTFQRVNTEYPVVETTPLSDLPVYAHMSYVFWNGLAVTNNLHSACVEVQRVIEERPEALSLLNRYGSRNPTYTALDLCPF